MAYITEFKCSVCTKDKREIVNGQQYPYTCLECRTAKANIDKHAALTKLQLMPIEARIEHLEAQLYDLNAEARIRALEARFHTYA